MNHNLNDSKSKSKYEQFTQKITEKEKEVQNLVNKIEELKIEISQNNNLIEKYISMIKCSDEQNDELRDILDSVL